MTRILILIILITSHSYQGVRSQNIQSVGFVILVEGSLLKDHRNVHCERGPAEKEDPLRDTDTKLTETGLTCLIDADALVVLITVLS